MRGLTIEIDLTGTKRALDRIARYKTIDSLTNEIRDNLCHVQDFRTREVDLLPGKPGSVLRWRNGDEHPGYALVADTWLDLDTGQPAATNELILRLKVGDLAEA